MTSKEFVIWFKGFVEAANEYNITPKQWDSICDQLTKVEEIQTPERYGRYKLDNENWKTTNSSERLDVTYKQDDLSTNTTI